MSRLTRCASLCAVLAAGCGREVLIVEVTASPPLDGLDRLAVQVDVGGQHGAAETAAGPLSLDGSPRTFAVDIPASLRHGPVTVHVDALQGGVVGSGEGTLPDVAQAIADGLHLRVSMGAVVLDGGVDQAVPPMDIAAPPDTASAPDSAMSPDGPDRDAWRDECARALACEDFEQTLASKGFARINNMNSADDTFRPDGGDSRLMRIVPIGNAMTPVRAGMTAQLPAATPQTNGLYVRMRLRVDAPLVRTLDTSFAAVYAPPPDAGIPAETIYLGSWGMNRMLIGRRFGVVNADFPAPQQRMTLAPGWHCVLWHLVWGDGHTLVDSHLWLDGMEPPGWYFSQLASLAFNRVNIGLEATQPAAAPDAVWIDDVLVTSEMPSVNCQ